MEPQPYRSSRSSQFAACARLLILALFVFSSLSCGGGISPRPTQATEPPALTESPEATEKPATTMVNVDSTPSPVIATLSLEEELERVQVELNKSLRGNFKYTAPTTMQLNESFVFELRLNPSLSAEELGTEIVQSGGLVTSTADPGVLLSKSGAEIKIVGSEVEITPLMKAVLVSQNLGAFEVQPLAEEVQPVGKQTTTTWQWLITARETGMHRLIMVIYRQINIDGKEYWPSVETHQAYIDVNVTFGQWLGSLDWKWIAGLLLTALLIPAFWRWVDQRRKQDNESPGSKSKKRKS